MQNHSKRRLHRNRTKYRRMLRVESLETRSLLAADCLGAYDLFASSQPNVAEGEAPAPILGFIPLEPKELAERIQPSLGLSEPIPVGNTFFLHSRPKATKTIYLDFDGFTAKGTPWNTAYNIASIVSPAWDPDRNGPSFTNNELNEIQGVWQRVAADFAPFDVDVTTEDPGEANLVKQGGADDRWGIRAVTTLTNFSGLNVGGFAYIGSFNWNYQSAGASDTPAYIFNSTSMTVAAAVSHEVGHSIGLSHDGTTAANTVQPSAEYYNGHGTGETGWGPIMGSGYYKNVTTWDDGTYLGSSNGTTASNFGTGASDLLTITQNNGFGFVPDTDANSDTLATTLFGTTIPGGKQTISKLGTIEKPGDVDFFKFQTGTGVVDITIDPYVNELWTSDGKGGFTRTVETSFLNGTVWSDNQGANLDVEATLYDGAGNVIAVSNPVGLRASFLNLVLKVGTYYVRVDGVGVGDPKSNTPTGYSDYGSIGQYLISGTIASSIEIGISDVSSYTENALPILIAPNASLGTFNVDTFTGGSLQFSITSNLQLGDRLGIQSSGTGPGQISLSGSDVLYGGTLIGILSAGTQNRNVTFNSATTSASVQAVIRALTFEHTTESPTTAKRQVTVFLDNAPNGASNIAFALVDVVPTNDSPVIADSSLFDVLEDDLDPPGLQVSFLVEPVFQDVDLGSSLLGIAVAANNASPKTGAWQYSDDGSLWSPIGNIAAAASLLLSRDAWIRFLPALNFNGSPTPLRIHSIDETFKDSFSTLAVRKTIDITQVIPGGPISLVGSNLTNNISSVNDAPIALITSQSFESLEDELFAYAIPTNSWFEDVDDKTLRLSLTQSNGRAIPDWLTFDPVTDILSGLPTNDHVANYDLVVHATDSSGAKATLILTLAILNVNDTPTAINLIGESVVENAIGVMIGTFFATDPDGSDTVVYSFPVADSRLAILGNQLFVAPGRLLDFEQTPAIELTVRATDSGSPPLFLDKLIRINVLDVNEFVPAFRPVTLTVQENATSLTTIGTLSASDGDTADRVQYRFVGSEPANFSLEQTSGRISLKAGATLDYESTDTYVFFVEAFDNGVPPLATASSVRIDLEDVNEFAPTISIDSILVSEKQQPNVVFALVEARDQDSRQKLVFSLPANENRFSIHPTSGGLSLNRHGIFDFEASTVSSLVVRVTDVGGRFEEKSLTVNITDANDAPTSATLASSILLSNISGIDLGPITIADQDVGQVYTVQPLDDRFSVQGGRLILATDRAITDSDPVSWSVPVIATDGGTNPITYHLSIGLTRIPNPRPWQNRMNALNVDRSTPEKGTLVNPLDALVVVNAINDNRLGRLPNPRPASTLGESDLDADGDGFLTPLDVLVIVNFLNGGSSEGGEGEVAIFANSNIAAPIVDTSLDRDKDPAELWLTAYRQIEEERELVRRRRG